MSTYPILTSILYMDMPIFIIGQINEELNSLSDSALSLFFMQFNKFI